MAGRQALNLDMGVRLSQPEPQPTEAQVNRRFPEHELTAERQRHGVTGHDNRITTTRGALRPRDPCLRSSNVEHPVLTRQCVGSSPTGGTMRTRPLGAALRSRRSPGRFEPCRPLHHCPRARRSCPQLRKPQASVRFRPGARRCARSSADERRCDMPEIAGSIPAARTRSCSSSRPRKLDSRSGNTGSTPVHDACSQDSVFQWTRI